MESLEYAEALQHVLDRSLETTIWTYGVFLPGTSTLSGLIKRAETTDFAALFLTPDDERVVRGEYLKTPRDNMVFELGLFIGCIGVERAFFLTPREDVDLPADLNGITPITYRTDRSDEDLFNAINPAATAIRLAVKAIGPKVRSLGESRSTHPDPRVLVAIGQIGATAEKLQVDLGFRPTGGSRFEITLMDRTGLGTSVEVDISDGETVAALDHLNQWLTSKQ